MLERSFLDALKADPNDDLARVTYMDWLDDQGDERGELLRAEIAGGMARGRRSVLASRAAPEWLAVVTLMARRVEAAWRVARPSFMPVGDAEDRLPWHESAAGLADVFAGLRTPRDGDFVVPYDYVLFQTMYPGGWFRDGGPLGLEFSLWSPAMALDRTAHWYSGGVMAEVDVGPDDLWLSFGSPWADHEELMLNCSPSSPRHGAVVLAGGDRHPAWAAARSHADSYLECLWGLAPPRAAR